MTRRFLYLALMLVASYGLYSPMAHAQDAHASDELLPPHYFQLPYAQRFPMVEYLAKNFAGYRSPLFPERRGLWAGIYWQTWWQQQSVRDQIGLWAVVNATLTIEPFYFGKDFQAKISCSESSLFAEFPQAKTKEKIATCDLWRKYFSASRQTSILLQNRNQSLLWAAHTSAIADTLQIYANDFSVMKDELPYDEGAYWDGWINLVYTLEQWNFSTLESSTAHISQNMLAACAPLGAEECLVDDLPNLRQQLLAHWLISGQGDLIALLTLP